MSTIVTRSGKGSALTHTEMDANFTNLNTDKLENITGQTIGSLSDVTITSVADKEIIQYDSATSKFINRTFAEASIGDMNDLVDDTTPQLGGALDPKGAIIGPDSTRLFQIIGNQDSPASTNYDSFSNTNRVHGVVTIQEVSNPANRVHSNPRLSLVTYTGNAGSQNGRVRHNYVEGVSEMAGFDNSQTGFGRGNIGIFISGKVENNNTSSASTVAQVFGATVSPQLEGTGDLTATDMRGIDCQPFITSTANKTATTLTGYHYSADASASDIGTHYAFKGTEAKATVANAGGLELPSVAVADLGTVAQRAGNMVFCTNETGGAVPVFFDGSDWRRVTDRAVASA